MKKRLPFGIRWTDAALQGIVDSSVLLILTGCLLCVFDPRYLFLKTTTAGGDTASHFYTAEYLKDVLLPRGRVSGWTQGNLAGFPILQFYFPLPFLIMAGLSVAVPLEIAFKLVTILGTLLLPISAYGMLRMMRCRFPVPSIGAASTLLFLFNEGNSMWGGNIPSTLAGEFSYSLSTALALLYLGSLYRDLVRGRGDRWVLNCLLVFLVGFSHGYPLLYVGVVSLFFLAVSPRPLSALWYLCKVYGFAFLLLGFWIVPLLAFSSYTIPYNIVWALPRLREVLPVVMAPAAAVSLLVSLFIAARTLLGFRSGKKGEQREGQEDGVSRPILFLWWAFGASAPLYLIAQHIGVVDIRFVPFAQLSLVLLAAPCIGFLARRLRAQAALALAAAVASVLWVDLNCRSIPHWVKWNYEGFERKAAWPQFEAITAYLRGTMAEPRVVFEHSPDHDRFGSTRAFESLPLFSGRATLEGVYHQASLSSPFIYYIQSEVSKVASCPFPQYSYAHLDPAAAIEDLELFNVGQYIVKSEEAKEAVRATPGYRLQERFADYEIYKVEANQDRYVTPLGHKPACADKRAYKRLSFQWFLDRGLRRVPVVFADRSACEDERFSGVVSGLKDLQERARQAAGAWEDDCTVRESVGNDEIKVETDCIGRPLLVKVSYHPNWKVQGADRVWLVSPSFMLVYPEKSEVILRYGRSIADYCGLGMSLLGLAGLCGAALRGRPGRAVPGPSGMERPQGSALHGRGGLGMQAGERALVVAVLSLAVAGAFIVLFEAKQRSPMKRFNQAIVLKDKGQYEDARRIFEQLSAREPTSSLALDSLYYIAITYYLEKDYDRAAQRFQLLADEYPSSHWVPEARYHIGVCLLEKGEVAKAKNVFEQVVKNHVGTVWHAYAQGRLAQLAAAPEGRAGGVDERYNEAIRLFNADRCDDAEPLLREIFETHPEYKGAAQALACYALCFFKKGRCEETVEYYSMLLQRYPADPLAEEARVHIERCTLGTVR